MSYLPPKDWRGRLLRPFARCQSLDIEGQIAAGAKAFDLRVYWEGFKWQFAHGAVAFVSGMDIDAVLDLLPDGSFVRIVLERECPYPSLFQSLCARISSEHPNLTFFGGYQKRPWKKLYTFEAEEGGDLPLHQQVGSMASDARWYERFIPIAYARRKGFSKTPAGEGITLIDFIN